MENGHFSRIYPFKMVIFHSYVSLPEGKWVIYFDNWVMNGELMIIYDYIVWLLLLGYY